MASLAKTKRPWEEVVALKRQAQLDALREFGHDDHEPLQDIHVSIKASHVINSLTSGAVTCEDLVKSHIQKTSAVHKATNCLTEVCFADALTTAKALDAHLAAHHTALGPLHGVPTTLKDQFNLQGHDTTLGYVGRAHQPAGADAALVRMLRALGAVLLAKTNLPQSIMWCETENPLWGRTTHPLDARYTPGGSTGGEAALLACGASVLGFGTDIGGSVRIPSHMMGLYGLKPSSSRLPYEGVPVSTEGQEHIPSSVGPMASSLDTLHLATKALIDLQPWTYDARCTPLPWNQDAYADVALPNTNSNSNSNTNTNTQTRPLVLGILYDDGVARPHPPLTRVLHRLATALRAAGHEIVDWDPTLHAECIELMDEFYTVDGGEDIRRDVQAGGEPMIPHVERLVARGPPISVYEYWQLHRRKWALQQAYLAKWNSIRSRSGSGSSKRVVDAVLLPPMPHAAVPHGQCRWVGYTKVWNVLDYTALVLPAGTVTAEDLAAPWEEAYEARGEMDRWSLDLWRDHGEEMARLALPVGVQIVGRRFEEEKVLGIGKVVDDILSQMNNV